MEQLERGMIVQVNETYPEICGCLMIIDEIKPRHILAYMPGHDHSVSFWYLDYSEFEVVGAAALVLPADEEGRC